MPEDMWLDGTEDLFEDDRADTLGTPRVGLDEDPDLLARELSRAAADITRASSSATTSSASRRTPS